MKEKELNIVEKIKKADQMAMLLSGVPKEDETFLLAITNAYADGLAAGQMLERNRWMRMRDC